MQPEMSKTVNKNTVEVANANRDLKVVFEGPVRSSFYIPKQATGNRNQSIITIKDEKTGLDRKKSRFFVATDLLTG